MKTPTLAITFGNDHRHVAAAASTHRHTEPHQNTHCRTGQCRDLATVATSEIDRLSRRLALTVADGLGPSTTAGSPPATRATYASEPVGHITPAEQSASIPPPPADRVGYPRLTPAGSLLDLLA